MKKQRWTKVFAIMVLMSQMVMPLQAAQQNSLFEMTKGSYRDTSNLTLPYIQIPGFLVSPLQQEGEVIASFNQSRTGYSHQGIDIRVQENTPVFASAEGIVIKAAPDSKGINQGGGHMIFINFGNGIEGRYMHLNAYGVKAGDHVRVGQVIGFTGNTGDSSTPHLHFEYRINGTPIDPAFIFEASHMIGQKNSKSMNSIQNQAPIYPVYKVSEPFFVVQS